MVHAQVFAMSGTRAAAMRPKAAATERAAPTASAHILRPAARTAAVQAASFRRASPIRVPSRPHSRRIQRAARTAAGPARTASTPRRIRTPTIAAERRIRATTKPPTAHSNRAPMTAPTAARADRNSPRRASTRASGSTSAATAGAATASAAHHAPTRSASSRTSAATSRPIAASSESASPARSTIRGRHSTARSRSRPMSGVSCGSRSAAIAWPVCRTTRMRRVHSSLNRSESRAWDSVT